MRARREGVGAENAHVLPVDHGGGKLVDLDVAVGVQVQPGHQLLHLHGAHIVPLLAQPLAQLVQADAPLPIHIQAIEQVPA